MNDSAYCFPIVPQGTSGGGSASSVVIQELNVTENGTYSAPSGVDGFSPVTVNVASSGGGGGGGTSGENRLAMLLSDTLTEVTEEDFGSDPKYVKAGAFYSCKSLMKVTIPSTVTSVRDYAFYNCTNLPEIDFPQGVKYLNVKVLYGCSSLKTIILRSDTVVNLTSKEVLSLTPFAIGGKGGTAYVPQALIESYKTATNWSALYEAGTCNFVAIEGSEYE